MEPDKSRVGSASHADLRGTRAWQGYWLPGSQAAGAGKPRAETCGEGAFGGRVEAYSATPALPLPLQTWPGASHEDRCTALALEDSDHDYSLGAFPTEAKL